MRNKFSSSVQIRISLPTISTNTLLQKEPSRFYVVVCMCVNLKPFSLCTPTIFFPPKGIVQEDPIHP